MVGPGPSQGRTRHCREGFQRRLSKCQGSGHSRLATSRHDREALGVSRSSDTDAEFEIDVSRSAKGGRAEPLGDPSDQLPCRVPPAPSESVKNRWGEADAVLVTLVGCVV